MNVLEHHVQLHAKWSKLGLWRILCNDNLLCTYGLRDSRCIYEINVTKMQVLRDSRYWIGEMNLKRKMEVTLAYRITYFVANIGRVFH